MKPRRTLYVVIGRTYCDLPTPVMTFRTALNLHRIPGLIPRLKAISGGKIIRPLTRRAYV